MILLFCIYFHILYRKEYVPSLLRKIFTINQNFKYILCLRTNICIHDTKPNLFFSTTFFLILRLCKNTKHSKISHNRALFFTNACILHSNPKYYCSSFFFRIICSCKSICVVYGLRVAVWIIFIYDLVKWKKTFSYMKFYESSNVRLLWK